MIDKINKLLLSPNEGDRLIAIELCKLLEVNELELLFDDPASVRWLRPSLQEFIDTHDYSTGRVYRLKHGYIAYNGMTWWLTNLQEAKQVGYNTETIY